MVRLFLITASLASALMAHDLMELYRNGGMKAIEKEIDRGLGDVNYWNAALAKKDLRFGYFEVIDTLLACSKEDATLNLYCKTSADRFSLKKSFSAYTGKYDGDKTTEGDRRTPIGVYTLDKKLTTVDPFYGPLAFVTSYPNLYDKIRGKNGSGIWIHGVPMSGSRDAFTRGCIAINNSDLLELDRTINPAKTIVIIDKQLQSKTDPQSYSKILAALHRWKYAWTYNDLETYLAFYDPSFVRFDGMNLAEFKTFKERVFAKNDSKTIRFDNLCIVPYPGEQKNLYMVTFDETYISDSHTFQGQKVLMMALNDNQSISILSEQ